MFEPQDRDEFEKDLRQAIHHMDQIGVLAPDSRRLLLSALGRPANKALTDDERMEFINAIAQARNEFLPHFSASTNCGIGNKKPAPGDIRKARICGSREAYGLRG